MQTRILTLPWFRSITPYAPEGPCTHASSCHPWISQANGLSHRVNTMVGTPSLPGGRIPLITALDLTQYLQRLAGILALLMAVVGDLIVFGMFNPSDQDMRPAGSRT